MKTELITTEIYWAGNNKLKIIHKLFDKSTEAKYQLPTAHN